MVCEGQMYCRVGVLDPGRLGLLREGLDKSVPRDVGDAKSDPAPRELIMCLEGEYLRGTQAVPDPELNSCTATRALQNGEGYDVWGSSEPREDPRVRGE